MSDEKLKIFERALARERAARKQAETILEEKSGELFSITQQLKESNQQLEELLREKTSQLRGVFENIVDSYVVMDLKGSVIKMNDAAKVLFGYDVDIEPLNVTKLIYKDDVAYAMESYQALVAQGAFTNYKARIYTKERAVKWVQINASLIYDGDKTPIAAQGIVRDVTEAHINAELIAEQQKKLAAIVDHSNIGIILTQFGKILQTNIAAQQLLEYSEEELMQLSVSDISNKEDVPISKEYMTRMNNGDLDHFVIEKEYLKKDGSKVWARTNVAAVRNDDGSIKYQVALIEDISEQLKNEEVKKELIQNLQRSNNELQEYAHVVSHDLKSPLRSIHALLSWIKEDNEGKFDAQTLENMGLMEETLEKMEKLIASILSYSGIREDNFEKEKVDLNRLIDEVCSLLLVPDHMEIKLLSELPSINGDHTKLQQLFQNLLGNAIRYNDKDRGLIEINSIDKGNYYEFSIKDNGMGIEKEYHSKIFRIFQSLHTDTESTGVGLAIVKKIVELHHGSVWLESKLGIGTTFFFTLQKN